MNYYNPTFNPMLNTQMRLNQMEQQYPQFAPQNQMNMGMNMQPQNNVSVGMLKGRPVTGIDEAKAAPIDFDGSVHIFPDIANKRIYTKQLGMDGLPVFSVYELKQVADTTPTAEASTTTTEYVSIEEFNTLKNKVEMFEQAILAPKKEVKSELTNKALQSQCFIFLFKKCIAKHTFLCYNISQEVIMTKLILNTDTNNLIIIGKIDSNLAGILNECKAIYTDNNWTLLPKDIPKLIASTVNYDVDILGNFIESENQYKVKTKCYPHQLDGIVFGIETPKFILGDEQGLGKTKQIIDIAINDKTRIKRCLIICGINGNKYNWEKEVQIHSDEKSWILGTRYRKSGKSYEGSSEDKLYDLENLPNDIFFIITNMETLRGLSENKGTKKRRKLVFPIAEKINALCKSGEIGMLVFDECQMAKNPDSQVGKALLSTSAYRMIAASGTPLMNNPIESYVPLRWLGYESHSFYDFKNHYCVMGGFHNSEIRGYKNLSEIRNYFNTIMLRRLKKDVLDLPPKIHKNEYVEMGKSQSKLYNDVLTHTKKDIDLIRLSPSPLAMMIRLRQATGYPGILSTTVTESAKLERLKELVEEVVSNDGKCIIFSQWSQMISQVLITLSDYHPLYITGEVDSKKRMENVDKFQNEKEYKVICGTIGAMGTGITLNAADTVIFLDEPWNRALKDQAEDRAHRIGTKGTVSVITLITKDTIDERINAIVDGKGEMADLLVDGKSNSKSNRWITDYLLS